MARTQIVTKTPEPPPGLELSPVPNLEGVERAAAWIHDKTITGRIRYHKTDEQALLLVG
jgi:hypothetical protein